MHSGTPVCRIRILALGVVAASMTCSNAFAAGSFQTQPAFPKVYTAGVAIRTPSVSLPSLSAHDLVGGCGRGRVRDAGTHKCLGPGDIR
jgi:hypothetical protein